MDSNHLLWMNIVSFLYHTLRMVNAYLYMLYILVVLNLREKSLAQFFYLCVPTIIALAVCFVGPLGHLVYFIDSSGIHHPGPLMPLLYLIALYYMLLIVFLTISYRKAIPFPTRIAFHSFGTLVMGTVLVERLFPTVMVEGFGSVLCQLLIYLTLQKPEEVIDGTTGLLNRLSFLRMISIRFRQKMPFDLIVIVMDNYAFLEKSLDMRVMSMFMRAAGTDLLSVTPKGSAYRISDGTFCVMVRRRHPEFTRQLLKQILERSETPWSVGGLNINLTAYVTLFQCPEDAKSPEEVLDLVEMALPDGQKRYHMDLNTTSRHRVQDVERAMMEALKNRSFEVYYQPIYSVAQKSFHSAEALLRLKDERLGPIGPDEFIPIAERNGMIVKIGRFVLDEVCRLISENRLTDQGLEYIEVNLSIVECLQDDLVTRVLEIINRYGLDTSVINFEITETASDTLPETVIRNISLLTAHGFRFSLDDYGTGYSNIGRILTMPLELIKLDKSIIQTYFASQTSSADIIMEETLHMLQKLHKLVVAEGVETQEQAERLIQIGCEYLQGYYYARPMPGNQFLEIFSA